MGKVRQPFQGILNIVRFNWHFYVIAIAFIVLIQLSSGFLTDSINMVLNVLSALLALIIIVSLFVSYYIYDLSGFYGLDWIANSDEKVTIANINAGFDETSEILQSMFKQSNIIALDFYDPSEHTEVSIKRARKRYPPFPGTKKISTSKIELSSDSIHKVFVILSAHEIRNSEERVVFFKELHRILTPNGQIIVIEHLRDISNFLAYNIGALHFHSKSAWLKTFKAAELRVVSEIKNTPFISTFILEPNGNTI